MRRVLTICAGVLGWTGVAAADLRVSAADAMKAAVSKPQPVYSSMAKQMKITGRVEVEAEVDETGKVRSAKALNGNPMLTQAAVSAVEKWKFTPFTADGKPEKAVCTLVFDFRP
jgi:TonB family protein